MKRAEQNGYYDNEQGENNEEVRYENYQGSESDEYTHIEDEKRNSPRKTERFQNGRTRRSVQTIQSKHERYEYYPPSVQERAKKLQAFRIKVYKDGDPLFKGVDISIHKSKFPTLESLLEFLNAKIDTRDGVRFLFNLNDQKRITKIEELQSNDECVVSSKKRFRKDIPYGSGDGLMSPIKNQRSSRGFGGQMSGMSQVSGKNRTPVQNKQISFNIISNTDRRSQEKMILNPQTNQTFEDFLRDMGDMLHLDYPPATGIYSTKNKNKPEKIESFSRLFQDVKQTKNFIICGREKIPKEWKAIERYDENKNAQNEEDDELTSSEADFKNSRQINGKHTEREYSEKRETRNSMDTSTHMNSTRNGFNEDDMNGNGFDQRKGRGNRKYGDDDYVGEVDYPNPRRKPHRKPSKAFMRGHDNENGPNMDADEGNNGGHLTSRHQPKHQRVTGPKQNDTPRKPLNSNSSNEGQIVSKKQRDDPKKATKQPSNKEADTRKSKDFKSKEHDQIKNDNHKENSSNENSPRQPESQRNDRNVDDREEDDYDDEDGESGDESPLPERSRDRKPERVQSPEY